MSTDRELLELAAKAAGYKRDVYGFIDPVQPLRNWNPFYNDGDALRLASRLNLLIMPDPEMREVVIDQHGTWEGCVEPFGNDRDAATRRAIVRAAAEIGKAMP